MNREYGGYLPIDSRQEEYFKNIDEKNIVRLNAARYAIVLAYQQGGFNKIWIPVYICASVIETFERYKNIQYDFYNIDENLEPLIDEVGDKECILVSNYYGQKDKDYYDRIIKKFKKVIFDNTQCFFIKPFISNGVYNVYSPRKFFGVSDGAYLIGEGVGAALKQCEYDKSGDRSNFLLSSLELGCNACYNQYLNSEDVITESGMKQMSVVTKTLLGNIDYERIRNIRKENYRTLFSKLAFINEFAPVTDAMSPMVYPLLIRNEKLRDGLIENKIYVSQWWKVVINNPLANDWEKCLSKYILPLPIDQRYNTEDMIKMVDIVKKLI